MFYLHYTIVFIFSATLFLQKEETFSLSSRPLCYKHWGKSGSEKIHFCLIYIFFNKIYIYLKTQWAVQFYQKTVDRFQVDTWRHWRGSSEKTSSPAAAHHGLLGTPRCKASPRSSPHGWSGGRTSCTRPPLAPRKARCFENKLWRWLLLLESPSPWSAWMRLNSSGGVSQLRHHWKKVLNDRTSSENGAKIRISLLFFLFFLTQRSTFKDVMERCFVSWCVWENQPVL